MADITSLITSVRIKIDDNPGDKSTFKENLSRGIYGNQVNGVNLDFQTNNKRITTGTLSVLADGSTATLSTSAAGLLRGRFSITSAAPATSCYATYDYQFFTDTEITEFLTAAGSFVGSIDPTTVADGLIDALTFKAASDACFALSSRTGMLYDASAGGKQAAKGDLAKKYRELAKDLFDRATVEREAFYGKRKGAATSPAYGKTNTNQRPWTPMR